jgi:hypothetical protein
MKTTKKRFNKAFVAEHVLRLHEARSREFYNEVKGSEAEKRAWGVLQALEWFSAGVGISKPGHYHRFVDAQNKPEKLTKETIRVRILDRIHALEIIHHFTSQTGWIQVEGKGSYANRAYGEYEILKTLLDELELRHT